MTLITFKYTVKEIIGITIPMLPSYCILLTKVFPDLMSHSPLDLMKDRSTWELLVSRATSFAELMWIRCKLLYKWFKLSNYPERSSVNSVISRSENSVSVTVVLWVYRNTQYICLKGGTTHSRSISYCRELSYIERFSVNLRMVLIFSDLTLTMCTEGNL